VIGKVYYNFFLTLVEAFIDCYKDEQNYAWESKCTDETLPPCINSKLQIQTTFSFFLT